MAKKAALGRGLGALLSSEENEAKVRSVVQEKYDIDDHQLQSSSREVDISNIKPNPFQPRTEFNPSDLEDLKNSIIEHGIIQPLTVRPKGNNQFELITGERRLRASKLAGLTSVPVYILDVKTDEEMLELALIENVQRQDLNPIEIALGYKRLMDECELTQEAVARKVGKDRTTVTNFLRLLKLPDYVKEGMVLNQLSMGHARALVPIEDEKFLLALFREIVAKELSVREVEKLVKRGPEAFLPKSKPEPKPVSPTLADVEQRLRSAFSTKVTLKQTSIGKGAIQIEYYSLDELDRILDLIESIKHQ